MSNTAAALANLLAINADINFYTQQSIYWNKLYEENGAKLQEQTKYYEKWQDACDKAIDNDKELTCGSVTVGKNNQNEALADAYAHAKVKQYNENLYYDLQDLDVEYDTMKTMYDTMLEELRAQKEAAKQVVSANAQDTGLIQS